MLGGTGYWAVSDQADQEGISSTLIRVSSVMAVLDDLVCCCMVCFKCVDLICSALYHSAVPLKEILNLFICFNIFGHHHIKLLLSCL